MATAVELYSELLERLREVSELESVRMVLEWDEQTEMQPSGSDYRAGQTARIEGIAHERFTHPRMGELLSELETKLEQLGGKGSDAEATLREVRRDYDHKVKLPKMLVEEMTTIAVSARNHWVSARQNNDFTAFAPWLEKNFELARTAADHLGHDGDPYDPLLDTYEPGMTGDDAEGILRNLRERLVPLIEAVTGAERQPDPAVLKGHFPIDKQRKFVTNASSWLGYNLEEGGIAESAHPFCITLGPRDVRFCTRFRKSEFADALLSTLHEAGHGMYEQGLPGDHYGTPLGQAVSLGIHESQSRMWENRIGRSLAFWQRWLPEASELFPDLAGRSPEMVHFAVNNMRPSLIRVEADELTYNLHIMIRFELERALLLGELKASDVPEAWNEKVRTYLGLEVPDDSRGCLQDIHWSMGLIGYFPTYAFGNIYAAQFVEAAEKELGDFDELIRADQPNLILDWFREKVHRHGRRFSPSELVERVTGKPPSSDALIEGLSRKAERLYGVTV